MAKNKDKKETAPAVNQKNNSAGKKRSTAMLTGDKGKVIRTIRAAASLSNVPGNDRKGLGLSAGKDTAKNLAGRLNASVKPGGKIDMLDEKGDAYSALKSAAVKALPSLKASKYDSNVQALLVYVLTQLAGSGGGGRKGFNAGALDFDF